MARLSPTSETTRGGKRRRLTEPYTLDWWSRGTHYRITVPADGHGFEVSLPRPPRRVSAIALLAIFLSLGEAYDPSGSWWSAVGAALTYAWTVVAAPRAGLGILADHYALEDVSAAHDWLYREAGDVPVEVETEGGWQPLGRPLTRAEADAVMAADSDDPWWLQSASILFVRAVGWYKWDEWDVWVGERVPF